MPTRMIGLDMQMVLPDGLGLQDGHCHFVQVHERGVLRVHGRVFSIDGTPMDPILFSRHSALMVLEGMLERAEISAEDLPGLQVEVQEAHQWLPNYVGVIPDDDEEEALRYLFPPRYARAGAAES